MWGLDARKLFSFTKRYMKIADYIKKNIDKSVDTIFVCTDSDEVIDEIERYTTSILNRNEWKFIFNKDSLRASKEVGSSFVWFLQNKKSGDAEVADGIDDDTIEKQGTKEPIWDIILDIELLKHADYLVGSMISNVFRLGAELNFAHNPTPENNVWSLDIPWFQDP